MSAATEGRAKPSLRAAIAWVCIALAYVIGLSFYKGAMMERLARQSSQVLKERHPKVLALFQASFYFFYDEQFLPGIRQALHEPGTFPPLEEIVVLSNSGSRPGVVLFDSSRIEPGARASKAKTPQELENAPVFPSKEVVERLSVPEPSVFVSGYEIRVLMPAGQYGILYGFDGRPIRNRVLAALVLGLLVGLAVRWVLTRRAMTTMLERSGAAWVRFWRLRAKFLATIVLINLITAGIVFLTLSSMQTREQTLRIEKESILFSQFSTAEVIANFTNFFYFYYQDRFLPETKKIIASNENLIGVRIISRRTSSVLFDSEQAVSGPTPLLASDAPKSEFAPEIEEQLKSRDLGIHYSERAGERLLSVVTTYRNENQEALFWVEYLFSFQSLARSIGAIRRQILIDLVPSLGLGLVIAVIFAQLLISPIRRLVAALQKVTQGDYDVTIEMDRTDELGDLLSAFNTMTGELRKKKELRKYLSDATYRQIMKAPDTPEGIKLGGTRVQATVLFSDIRNFVSHCEALDAEEVTAMLNEYFSEMVDVVYKHGGEVDKFIGDALLAVFYSSDETRTIRPSESSGAQASAPPSAATSLQAIYCALEMREKLAEFNERRRSQGKSPIETGVGITHGEIISGPIGSKDRMDFTVIGDVVNLASRIEKMSKEGKHSKIIFSNHVEEKVRGLLDYVEMGTEKIRGKEELVRTFELVGVRDLQALVGNLRGADLALRRQSVELLGHSRNSAALPYVIEALRDSDEATRLQAVLALVKLAPPNDAQALRALSQRLRAEGSDKVLSALVTALGKLSTADQIDLILKDLVPFLDSPNERIVANVVESLGQVRSPKCTDLILPKLSSRNNRVKANAAMALFAAGHVEVIDTLKPMLMHSDPLMRSSAAFAIGELTVIAEQDQLLKSWRSKTQSIKLFLAELQECVPMLVSLLRDPEPMVKRQAVIALGKIKDKSAILPIIEMLDPAQDSKELVREVAQALRSIGSHKLVREVISRLT